MRSKEEILRQVKQQARLVQFRESTPIRRQTEIEEVWAESTRPPERQGSGSLKMKDADRVHKTVTCGYRATPLDGVGVASTHVKQSLSSPKAKRFGVKF